MIKTKLNQFSEIRKCRCYNHTILDCNNVFGDNEGNDEQKLEHLFHGQLSWIQKLSLRNAMLQTFEARYVTKLTNLTELDMTDNYLENVVLTYTTEYLSKRVLDRARALYLRCFLK